MVNTVCVHRTRLQRAVLSVPLTGYSTCDYNMWLSQYIIWLTCLQIPSGNISHLL